MKVKLRKHNWKKEWGEIKELASKLKFKYFIPALILPVISMIIFLLPQWIQNSLKLVIKQPRMWQFITSAYTHNDSSHLFGNLGLYTFLAILLIYLAFKSSKVKEFNKALLLSLILFPIISSIANITIFARYFTNLQTNCGASGLVGMMLGFLPVFWLKSVYPNVKSYFSFMNISALYLALTLVLVYTKNLFAIVVVTLFLVGYVIFVRREFSYLIKQIPLICKRHFIFFVVSTTAILTFLLTWKFLFPPILTASNGTLTNFFTHYIGAVYGIVFSFIIMNFKRSKEKIKSIFHKSSTP